MIRKERMSRWVMYLSVFGMFGALQSGIANSPYATLFMVLLFLQYPAIVFWNGYTEQQRPGEHSA